MFAKKVKCTVLSVQWISPSVFRLTFKPSRSFDYLSGQFISVVIPDASTQHGSIKRCYSLANSPERAKTFGYELYIKNVEGGKGSSYLAQMQPGDTMECYASYGNFFYKPTSPERISCFIATGTGIAPIRSILQSGHYQNNSPQNALLIYGARNESEVLYAKEFEKLGIEVVVCLSEPTPFWSGFTGRVTDVLKQLPREWAWHGTDFYICGAPQMVNDVNRILTQGHNVNAASICKEAFEASKTKPRSKPSLQLIPHLTKNVA